MKRLLMIIPFFPPMAGGGVHRALSFVKYLSRYGWQPVVVAQTPESFWVRDGSLMEEIPEECEVTRTRSWSGQRILSAIKRRRDSPTQVRSGTWFAVMRKLGALFLLPDTYAGWYPFALRAGRKILAEKSIDAIYSTSPPETSHLVAYSLHADSGLPWVADFRDPWMNLFLMEPPTPLHRWLHSIMHAKVCASSQPVVTSRWHADMLRSRLGDGKPITILPNGYDRAEMEKLRCLGPAGDRFTIVHSGMLTQRRSAEPFLRALALFLQRKPELKGKVLVRFLGAREDRNDKMVSELDLGDVVSFIDTVPHKEALKLERASHVLLLIKHLDARYRGIVPGKIYEYIGVGRPILALVPEGEAKELVIRLRCGEAAPQDDIIAIADKIELLYERFVRGDLDEHYDLSLREQFERDKLTGRLAELLDTLT